MISSFVCFCLIVKGLTEVLYSCHVQCLYAHYILYQVYYLPVSVTSLAVVLPYSFIWDIFLYPLILSLSACWESQLCLLLLKIVGREDEVL